MNNDDAQSGGHQDVIICRCEEISESAVVAAIHAGCRTIAEVKRYSRTGMGLCQGRTCGPIVRDLLARESADGTKVDDPFAQKHAEPAAGAGDSKKQTAPESIEDPGAVINRVSSAVMDSSRFPITPLPLKVFKRRTL